MRQNTVTNSPELAGSIKNRRLELGLTIEVAASKAGVGTKTWCRYEAGESIRGDKVWGICKALNWNVLPNGFDDESSVAFDLSEYRRNEAWSKYLSEEFGDAAAVSFVIGSEILLDHINEDLQQLSVMKRGTHIGELDFSMLSSILPEQFLMEYNYEFMYKLRCEVLHLRAMASYDYQIIAHSVIEELALYLIVDSAEFLMDCWKDKMTQCGIEVEDWNEWIFDLFDDMDVVTWLYSDHYIDESHNYHFKHWFEEQFYLDRTIDLLGE